MVHITIEPVTNIDNTCGADKSAVTELATALHMEECLIKDDPRLSAGGIDPCDARIPAQRRICEQIEFSSHFVGLPSDSCFSAENGRSRTAPQMERAMTTR